MYRRVSAPLGIEGRKLRCGGTVEERELLPNQGKEPPAYLHYLEVTENYAGVAVFVHCRGPDQWHSKPKTFIPRLDVAYGGQLAENKVMALLADHVVDFNSCPCASNQCVYPGGEWCSKCGQSPLAPNAAPCPRPPDPPLPLSTQFVRDGWYYPSKCLWRAVSFGLFTADRWDGLYPRVKSEPSLAAFRTFLSKHPALFKNASIAQPLNYTPCCAQFSLPRWRMQIYPKTFYRDLRMLLLQTHLDDAYTSRVMEFSWRIWFHNAFVSLDEARAYHLVEQRYNANRPIFF